MCRRTSIRELALCLTVLAGTFASLANAQVPLPAQGSSPRRPPQPEQPTEATGPLPVFEFHSGFWINLHHFLNQQARASRSAASGADARAEPAEQVSPAVSAARTEGLPASLDGFSANERRAWEAAVAYYAGDLAARDLLFNGDMVAIKNRLAEIEGAPELRESGLRPELIAALEKAAPVYRARFWADHDRTNRAWIATVGPLVRQHGAPLAKQLAAIYGAAWPPSRLRVDVSYSANWAGAYTTLDPVHTTISSSMEANQGPAALEILFHEASHALAGEVREAIARESRARNRPIPRDLWHAVLFYTTGEIVRRVLSSTEFAAGHGPKDYTPYAYRYGLYARGWQNYQRVLERHWQPYLDGHLEFDRAIARMVDAL